VAKAEPFERIKDETENVKDGCTPAARLWCGDAIRIEKETLI